MADGKRGKEEKMNIPVNEILSHVDHTLLLPTATWEQIRQICDDAALYRTASVCIPPCHVRQAAEYLAEKAGAEILPGGGPAAVIPVCTVIGFPNGNMTTRTKVFEAQDAIGDGAAEIDMVINIGWLKEKKYDLVQGEIRALKEVCGERILKVIVETCFLTQEEKIRMCRIVTGAGADYIKTSTGFGTGGAAREDIELFLKHIGPGVKIKAAGGVSDREELELFLKLGCDRVGMSRTAEVGRELAE